MQFQMKNNVLKLIFSMFIFHCHLFNYQILKNNMENIRIFNESSAKVQKDCYCHQAREQHVLGG